VIPCGRCGFMPQRNTKTLAWFCSAFGKADDGTSFEEFTEEIPKIRGVNECAAVFNFAVQTNHGCFTKRFNVLCAVQVVDKSAAKFFRENGCSIGCIVSEVRSCALPQPRVW